MASSSAFLTGTLRCKDRESAPSPKSHFAFGSMPVSSSSVEDRKSTRLNSSHSQIPYAVSCLKKKERMVEERMFRERSELRTWLRYQLQQAPTGLRVTWGVGRQFRQSMRGWDSWTILCAARSP